MDDAQGFAAGLKEALAGLEDPRVVGRCDHQLFDIIAIAVLATFCGADEWAEIADFGRARQDWLQTFLELPGGIPTDDTFRRVLGRLDRTQFAAKLFAWLQAMKAGAKRKRFMCGLDTMYLITVLNTLPNSEF